MNGYLAASIISIISFLSAVYFYFAGKKERKPMYLVIHYSLVRNLVNKLPGLEIRYEGHGQPCSNFSACRVAIWNGGRETIRKQDVVSKDPFIIPALSVDQVFLDVKVETTVNSHNAFDAKITHDKKQIKISFDYIDYTEGAVLQIIHTGTGSKSIKVQGTVMGAGSPQRLGSYPGMAGFDAYMRKSARIVRKKPYILTIFYVLLFLFIAITTLVENSTDEKKWKRQLFPLSILGVFMLGVGSTPLILMSHERKIPKPLRKVTEPLFED
jgi:hypothetical protein